MKSRFTPGEWFVETNKYGDALVREPTGCIIADVLPVDSSDQHEANAHLIAAAPRLHSHAEMGADLLPLVSEWFQASPEERAKEGPDWEARAHMAVLALLDDAKTALLLVSPQSSDPVVQSENGQEQ